MAHQRVYHGSVRAHDSGLVSVLARNWYPRGVVAQLINIVYSITEPPLRWLRRYIRPLPLGSIYLDVSFIVLYFALVVLESVVLIVF